MSYPGKEATTISDAISCFAAFASLKPQELAKLSLATGKSLPADAGRFIMCTGLPSAHYVFVNMLASQRADGEDAMKMGLGLCLPEGCEASDVPMLMNSSMVSKVIPDLTFLHLSHVTAVDPLQDVATAGLGFHVAISVVSLLLILVVASTLVVSRAMQRVAEGTPRSSTGSSPLTSPPSSSPRENESEASQQAIQPPRIPLLCQAFSLFGSNGTLNKLVEGAPAKPTDCLNGLRVLSMVWIILGHSFLMPEGISGYSNPQDIAISDLNQNAAETNPMLMFVLSAELGVDTFFFLSGFLLSLLTLKELRTRPVNPIKATVLRYVRLTPSLGLVMMVYYLLWPYLGYGPFAVSFQNSILDRCRGSWWSELTYTMNFFPFDSDKVCMGWTWYLGDDMIFFILGIVILPIYHRSKALGWICVSVLCGICFGVTGWLIAKHHLTPYVFDNHYVDYSYYAYSKPYNRAPAYFVGITAAWLLEAFEERHPTELARTARSSQKVVLATLSAFLIFCVLVFLIVIPTTDFGIHKNTWGDWQSILLLDVGRFVWALCWAILTILCYRGHLPWTDGFLAHRFWTPLARLTYGAYLIHPMIIKLAAGTSVQYYTFSGMDLFYRHVGNTMTAFSGSVILWCLVERPAMTFTTALLKRPARSDAERKASRASA